MVMLKMMAILKFGLALTFVALLPIQECMRITQYTEEPSSTNITCNPYGMTIQLHCAIEEPANIKVASQLLLLWYWTPPGASSVNQSCQIYPQYQCNQYVGINKYDFIFKRFHEESSNGTIIQRRVDLIINDVGTEDQGCYNCRPWIDASPLPVEESSETFCLKQVSHYQNQSLLPCNYNGNVDYTTITNTQAITTSTTPIGRIEVTSTVSSDYIVPSTVAPITSSSSTSILAVDESILCTNNEQLLWTIALSVGGACVCLCVLVFVLSTVMIWQWYDKCRDNNSPLGPSHNITASKGLRNSELIEVSVVEDQKSSDCSQNAIPVPMRETHTYAEPPYDKVEPTKGDKLADKVKDSCHECHSGNGEEINSKTDETGCYSVSVSKSPSAHVYQTLDKYLEELLQSTSGEALARNGNHPSIDIPHSDDLLFDDPNYSPIEISKFHLEHLTPPIGTPTNHVQSPDLLPSEDTPLVNVNQTPPTLGPAPQIRNGSIPRIGPPLYSTVERTYDKLEPKRSEAEYSYAYSHIMKLKKKLKKLKSKEDCCSPDFNTEAACFQLELVQVAAMAGGYEIDPEILISLENISKTDLSKDDDTKTTKHIANKEVGDDTTEVKSTTDTAATDHHQYQSLTRTTRNIENGYAILVK